MRRNRPAISPDLLTWLERWSRELVEDADAAGLTLTDEQRATRWIGNPPASAAAIAATEARLGVRLPPSLLELYSITDGWPTLSMDFQGVRPVSELGWFRDLRPGLIQYWWLDDDEADDDGDTEEPDGSNPALLLQRCLLLSTGPDHFLLDPARRTGEEWGSVDFTNWYPGPGREHPTFRDGLESHYTTFYELHLAP